MKLESTHFGADDYLLAPLRAVQKRGVSHRSNGETNFHGHTKNDGGSWFNIAHNTESGVGKNPVHALAAGGLKLPGNNGPRRGEDREVQRLADAGRKMPAEINESIRQGKSPARWTNPDEHYFGPKPEGTKCGEGNEHTSWFNDKGPGAATSTARFGSKSNARKAASAQIAMIPLPLGRYLARVFKP